MGIIGVKAYDKQPLLGVEEKKKCQQKASNWTRQIIGTILCFMCYICMVSLQTLFQRLKVTINIVEFQQQATTNILIITFILTPKLLLKRLKPKVERSLIKIVALAGVTQALLSAFTLIGGNMAPLGAQSSVRCLSALLSGCAISRFRYGSIGRCTIFTCAVMSLAIVFVIQPRVLFRNVFTRCCSVRLDRQTQEELYSLQNDNSNKSIQNNDFSINNVNMSNINNTILRIRQSFSNAKKIAASSIFLNISTAGGSSNDNARDRNNTEERSFPLHNAHTLEYLGYFFVALAGLIVSINTFLLESIYTKLEVDIVMFWAAIFNIVIALIPMILIYDFALPNTEIEWVYFVSILVSYVGAVFFFQYCILFISALSASVIQCSLIAMMFISQYTINYDILPGNHNWVELIGGATIFIAFMANAIYNVHKTKNSN